MFSEFFDIVRNIFLVRDRAPVRDYLDYSGWGRRLLKFSYFTTTTADYFQISRLNAFLTLVQTPCPAFFRLSSFSRTAENG